ncbi:hypothetical protein HanIR_Chr09g0431691 [Helianthus annuus]|nr:hypothetical protein HanIR_Chr09g0431691 [Helianthus annuus]
MAVRGSEVVFILARKGRCERASIDEVVSYKPPVISTFQFMTWEPKSNGCSKASISSHISLRWSEDLDFKIELFRELFPDLAPLVLLQPSYRFVFMLLKRHFTFPLCAVTSYKEIAYQCLHLEREKRPTTREVLVELKKALEFQVS